MKKILFTFLVLFSCGTMFSQVYFPLVEEGKVWSTYMEFNTGDFFSTFNKFEGDTIIGTLTYKKVWETSDTNLVDWVPRGLIRESNFKVYYIDHSFGDEELIYDFMVNTGDTIYLRKFYTPYVLDSIDLITLLNGEQRPIYYYSSPWYPYPGYIESWIEGVGSSFGIIYGGSLGFVGGYSKMMCFTENGILKYKNPSFESCYIITSINNPARNEFTLYPNPTSGVFTIQFRDQQIAPLIMEFRDLTGKAVKTVNLQPGVNPVTIQAPSSGGMYFFRILNAGEIMSSGKILVY